MTILDNTSLPLWVYIILITVGSILVLATVAFGVRWWFIRRKYRNDDLDSLTGPTRRLTVRRGRVVPTSQHLSLTGSKFGMRQFGLLADNESAMTRSKSPFEWWTSMMDRSQSRQDQLSMAETGSFTTRPASRATTIATRRELGTTTPTMTPEKNKEPVTRTWEIELPSDSPPPTPPPEKNPVNFSRSLAPRTPNSPLFPRSQSTLSRIEEHSPRLSMASVQHPRSKRTSYYEPVNSTPLVTRAAEASAIPLPRQNIRPRPTELLDANGMSALKSTSTRDANRRSAGEMLVSTKSTKNIAPSEPEPPRPRTAGATTSSQTRKTPPKSSIPVPSSTLAVPKPVSYRGSRSTLGERQPPQPPQPRNSSRISSASRSDSHSDTHSIHSTSRKSSASIGPSGIFYDPQVPDYWNSRTDLQDLSLTLMENTAPSDVKSESEGRKSLSKQRDNVTLSKSNSKVLRKKSLKKSALVSSLAN